MKSTSNEKNRIPFYARSKTLLDNLNEISKKLNISRNELCENAILLGLPLLLHKYNLQGIDIKNIECYDLSEITDESFNVKLEDKDSEISNKYKGMSLEDIYYNLSQKIDSLATSIGTVQQQNNNVLNGFVSTKEYIYNTEKTIRENDDELEKKMDEKMGEIKQQIRSLEELTSRENIAVKSTQMMTSYSANFITTIFKGLCYPKFPSMDGEKIKDFQKKSSYTLLSPFKEEYEAEIEKLNEQIKIRRKNEEGKL